MGLKLKSSYRKDVILDNYLVFISKLLMLLKANNKVVRYGGR